MQMIIQLRGRVAALTSAITFSICSALGLLLSVNSLAGVPAELILEEVTSISGRAVAVQHAGDGSGRLFIVEQTGQIFIWDGSQVLTTPFLDIRSLVDDGGNEQGLLGLAFHPDYASNGHFYVNYTYDPGLGKDRTRIARYTRSVADANVANSASDLAVIEIEQDYSNHNGGDLQFGPDGYLYIGMGDGGSSNDPNSRAQDLNQLLGKMLRIDVDGSPPVDTSGLCDANVAYNYGIPASNPYSTPGDGGCDEIWASGLRNPWRYSFDRLTGDLFIGDVGQGAVEEIDLQPASSSGGENYGWRCKEGTSDTSNVAECSGKTVVDPLFEYSHSLGCSVTGGYRYRGAINGLYGIYVYADYCSGRIWFGSHNGQNWSSTLWQDTSINISSFGEDEEGELYLVSLSGTIYRFENPGSVACSGVNVDIPSQVVAAGEDLSCTGSMTLTATDLVYEAGSTGNVKASMVNLSGEVNIESGARFTAESLP